MARLRLHLRLRRIFGMSSVMTMVALVSCTKSEPAHELQGIVEYDERILSFEVAGKIERVPVKRGDVVKKGDLLAEVDSTLEKLARDARADDARAAQADVALLEAGSRKEDVASLTAQLRGAEATEGMLEKSRNRARQLFDAHAISQAELDRADADLARASNERASLAERVKGLRRGARSEEITRAKARAEAAQSALALENARIEKFEVRSGGDGTLLDVHVDPGELAGPGVPVATVADTSHPFVDVFVPQGELAGIVVGAKTTVRVDGLAPVNSPASGVVEHVESRTEFTPKFIFSERERPNLVVRVRVRVDDPDRRLHAGIPAFVQIAKPAAQQGTNDTRMSSRPSPPPPSPAAAR